MTLEQFENMTIGQLRKLQGQYNELVKQHNYLIENYPLNSNEMVEELNIFEELGIKEL